MIADTFYPKFTITITNLVCFMREKKQSCSGVLHPPRHQGITLGLQEDYSSHESPSCNRFWLWQKPMCPYLFCIIFCLDSEHVGMEECFLPKNLVCSCYICVVFKNYFSRLCFFCCSYY